MTTTPDRDTLDALDHARHLAEHGVPIFVARPATDLTGQWDPTGGTGGSGYLLPTGWERTAADPATVNTWRPGMALCAVMGHAVDGLDVDPRAGGDATASGWVGAGLYPTSYGQASTPSGGWHELVAPLGVGSRDNAAPGIDVKGGRPGGNGRGFLFIAPTVKRSKVTGDLAAYRWTVPPNLDELDAADDSAAWLADRIRQLRPAGRARDTTPADRAHFDTLDAHEAARVGRYLDAAAAGIAHELADAAAWPVGHRDTRGRGWQKLVSDAAYRLGALARAPWTPWSLADAYGALAAIVPPTIAASVPPAREWAAQCHRATPAPFPAPDPLGLASSRPARPARTGTRRAPLDALGALLAHLREWQHVPDPTHVVATLAAAATHAGEGEPCWLLLVAPPSSGKTETVRLLDDAAAARLDEVTAAGLLGWSKTKTAVPSGVLTRCGPRALVTFGDLSSLLATSDRGGRDQVFGLLRRAYDGHVTRDVSPPGRTEGTTQLSWTGRLTVVACVTGAIDRYAAHADQLGARWLYCRIPDRTLTEKRHAARLARRGGLAALRQRAREEAAAILEDARIPDALPGALLDAIEDAALVTAWGRAAVPRNGYGRRDIEGVPIIEEPMRLVQQLGAIAGGVLALGLPEAAAAMVARRLALDSMPAARHAVLSALASGEVLTTAGVARTAGLDRKVARFNLEELAAVGVVEHDRTDDENDEPAGTVHWCLSGDDGAVIAEVFAAARAAGGWDETWVPTPPPPQIQETPTGVHPTLRPTPGEPPEATP